MASTISGSQASASASEAQTPEQKRQVKRVLLSSYLGSPSSSMTSWSMAPRPALSSANCSLVI